jgi:glycosyltransferase involved in cell wall biosynthesis
VSEPPADWRPKVTALLPCYNAAAFITRTLDSLAAQTWPDLEILIGEDASTDATLTIISDFATRHPNVRIIRNPQNLGWLRNSNALMAEAKGELLFFAFHDDAVEPSYVERLVDALRDRPRAVLAYSDLELYGVEGGHAAFRFDAVARRPGPLSRGFLMAGQPIGWWVPNRGLFRASAFARIGGIKPHEAGEFSADWTWLLHMSLLGDFVRVPELLCRKYYQKASLSRGWDFSRAQRQALRRAAVREVWNSGLDPLRRIVLSATIWTGLPRLLSNVGRRLRRRA